MADCPLHGVYTEGTLPGCPQCEYARMNAHPPTRTRIIIPCPRCASLEAKLAKAEDVMRAAENFMPAIQHPQFGQQTIYWQRWDLLYKALRAYRS